MTSFISTVAVDNVGMDGMDVPEHFFFVSMSNGFRDIRTNMTKPITIVRNAFQEFRQKSRMTIERLLYKE